METGYKPITIALLLSVCMGNTFAQSRTGGFYMQENARFIPMQMQRGGQGADQQMQRQNEQHHGRAFSFPQNGGAASGGDNFSNSNNAYDAQHRQSKMSPEERRALRQQIDEAGHDIYAPRR
jgi:hypothetical protein